MDRRPGAASRADPALRPTRGAGLLLVGVLALALALAGCGYRSLVSDPGASTGSVESDRSRLAVIALRSDSPEPWLDRILTEALRRELDARSRFDLVAEPARADLVLRGRIRPLAIQSRSFSSFVAALEYTLTLSLDLEVVRPDGVVVRLDPGMLSETDYYLASADIEVTRTNRLELLRRLSDELAVRVADSVELLERPMRPDRVEPEPPAADLSDAKTGASGVAGGAP